MESTKPLTPFQQKYIAKVFRETRDEMASYLREWAKVFIPLITEQNFFRLFHGSYSNRET